MGSRCGVGTFVLSADLIHHSVAVKYTVAIVAAHQYIRKLVHFMLVFTVEVGESAVRTVTVAQFKLDLVKPWGINVDCDIELIVALVAARIVALLEMCIRDRFGAFPSKNHSTFPFQELGKIHENHEVL